MIVTFTSHLMSNDDNDDFNHCKLKSRVISHGKSNQKVKLKVRPLQLSLLAQRVVVVDHESSFVSHQW